MPGKVLVKSLRDLRWSIVGWGIGFGLLAMMMVALFPYIEAIPQFDELVKAYPPAIQAFFGGFASMGTIKGFLSVEFFSWALLILAIFVIMEGSAAIAGEEEKGTMDLLLGNPIPRWRVVVEKFAALVLALLAIEAIILVSFAISLAWAGITLSYLRLLQALFDVLVGTLFLGSLSLFTSSTLSTRRGAALIVAVLLIACYFVNSLGKLVEWLRPFRRFTLFYYHGGGQPLTQGLNWAHLSLLLGLSLAFLLASIVAFERRDLAV